MHEYGKKTAQSTNPKIETKTQFIVVEHDEAVMNSKTIDVSSNYKDKSICALPSSADHSLISKFDNPDTDMWWLDDMLGKLNRFLTRGEFVAKDKIRKFDKIDAC